MSPFNSINNANELFVGSRWHNLKSFFNVMHCKWMYLFPNSYDRLLDFMIIYPFVCLAIAMVLIFESGLRR